MISVKELYQRTYEDVVVLQRRGYVTPEEATRGINNVQRILYSFYVERGEERPLMPFTETATVDVVDSILTKPADYADVRTVYLDATLSKECGVDLERLVYTNVSASNFRRMANDAVLSPMFKKDRAWMMYSKGFIEVSPAPKKIKIDYYREPRPAVVAMTYDINDQTVFDPSGSVDLEWDSSEFPNFITLLLASIGVSQRSSDLMEYAQSQGLALSVNNS